MSFAPGARVRARALDPDHHNRLPRYVRGQTGEVIETEGQWPVPDDLARGSLRFGLGRFNTEAEVDFVTADVVRAVNYLRSISPGYEMHRQGFDQKAAQWAAH